MLNKDLLLSVSKPARYVGGELNSIKKDHSGVDVRVCLCFPDIYEIGMSHHGLRILYDIVNASNNYLAERVFSPWIDMEEKLREENILLSSIESSVPVKNFDILGFSLQYELSYTNVLNILSLSGIPLRAQERSLEYPLVIAGGVTCLNPEPMADFIDAFVIGEAEEAILEILEVYRIHKQDSRQNKTKLLKALALIEGVYVPSIRVDSEEEIAKRYVKDLDKVLGGTNWIVPFIEIVHDRVGIEIMRGCPNKCRFCQARSSFFPMRLVSEEKVLETARRLYQHTGYEEISLLSLSSSDHPKIENIVERIMDEFRDKGVSISLPSIRSRSLVGGISEKMASNKKTALTFAPEAGSQRLRDLINKNIDIEEFMDVALRAYKSGYRLLKLYFMIGLPTETDADIEEIFLLCQKLSQLKKKVDGHPARLNVSISNFVPKPHTPFQWQAMLDRHKLADRHEQLRYLFRRSRGFIKLKFHDPGMSFVEGVLSRGDRRLSRVIGEAFLNGARFDAWNSMFNLSLWQDAFLNNAIEPNEYLCLRDYSDILPWDFIATGVRRQFLIQEAISALSTDVKAQ